MSEAMTGLYVGVAEGMVASIGPNPHNKVVEWAKNLLANNQKVTKVHVAALEATAERSSPPIVLTPYSPGNERVYTPPENGA